MKKKCQTINNFLNIVDLFLYRIPHRKQGVRIWDLCSIFLLIFCMMQRPCSIAFTGSQPRRPTAPCRLPHPLLLLLQLPPHSRTFPRWADSLPILLCLVWQHCTTTDRPLPLLRLMCRPRTLSASDLWWSSPLLTVWWRSSPPWCT